MREYLYPALVILGVIAVYFLSMVILAARCERELRREREYE